MKILTITIEGEDGSDLEEGFGEVKRLVSEGYLSGFNSNDTGEFHFQIKEED